MRLSTTDIYAFQALGYLGTQPLDRWVSSDEISESTGIARPYLVRVLAVLSGKGIVKSKKGIGGGYALSRKPHLISLCEVVRAVDGPVAPLSCISLNWHEPCVEEPRCHARTAVWQRIRDALLAVLGDVSVADLAKDFQQGVNYQPCLHHLLRPNV
ncbi:Rrf2 family protein [Deinobacterium chartae]|uniref:Rrf2 family protein n=1 Tax=Deinobacterium chartae TaxID=521158 RepID=A0A841HX56_9DEIO|nr:RrF2 family transcriptional regulator [Deinobacterium chartae]MBB6097987.1 Rrf2 family protein [Deinobacterium chartae]